MLVSIDWLKQLIDLNGTSIEEVVDILNKKTIATKEVTDRFIELDMKGYNRADLLYMWGVAYEVLAIIEDPDVKLLEKQTDDKRLEEIGDLDIDVTDQNLSPLYSLIKIEGLKIDKSPENWVKKLEDSGMRSVNNITDVTNLVMLEYGQPLHAFDASKVRNEKIIVRTATEGEEIETLDGKKRTLTETDLLITDSEKALGIAGVMGGKNSEIPDSGTVDILLEAAIFDPVNIRKTASRLGLHSEASKRFQHGLTERRLMQALNKAIEYYQDLGGKVTAIKIVGDYPQKKREIRISLPKVRQLIGVDITNEEIDKFTCDLLWEVTYHNDDEWTVYPNFWRLDINIEADVIEEFARLYGYDKIQPRAIDGIVNAEFDENQLSLDYKLKKFLSEMGLSELQTYSYFSANVLENFGWLEKGGKEFLVKIMNPMSKETEYMRQNLWANLLEKTAENLKYHDDIAVFEIGKSFTVNKGEIEETTSLAIAISNETEEPIYELIKIFEELNKKASLNMKLGKYDLPETVKGFFHPNRFIGIMKDGKQIGGISEVHPRLTHKFGTDKRIAVLELYLP